MKKHPRKLKIDKITIQPLTSDRLRNVGGGSLPCSGGPTVCWCGGTWMEGCVPF